MKITRARQAGVNHPHQLVYLADLSLDLSDRGGPWALRNRPMHESTAQLVREELRPAFRELEARVADLSTAGAEMGELPGRPSEAVRGSVGIEAGGAA